jgi:hypothetical protein
MRRTSFALTLGLLALLAGCDQLGIESAAQTAARREADGKAIGAGCRHAARSVEQCYALNKRSDRSAIFAGWKEMNEYMAENKIEAVPAPAEAPKADAAEAAEDDAEAAAGNGDKKPAKLAKVSKKGG